MGTADALKGLRKPGERRTGPVEKPALVNVFQIMLGDGRVLLDVWPGGTTVTAVAAAWRERLQRNERFTLRRVTGGRYNVTIVLGTSDVGPVHDQDGRAV